MGVQPFLIPASLNIVIAQRLIKKLCPECKQEMSISEIDKITLKNIKNSLSITPKDELQARVSEETLKSPKFFKAVGCPACENN